MEPLLGHLLCENALSGSLVPLLPSYIYLAMQTINYYHYHCLGVNYSRTKCTLSSFWNYLVNQERTAALGCTQEPLPPAAYCSGGAPRLPDVPRSLLGPTPVATMLSKLVDGDGFVVVVACSLAPAAPC